MYKPAIKTSLRRGLGGNVRVMGDNGAIKTAIASAAAGSACTRSQGAMRTRAHKPTIYSGHNGTRNER